MLACGSNDCGQSGHRRDADGAPIEPEGGLAVVKKLKGATSLRGVRRHCSWPCQAGRVFTCGVNDDGALGRPTKPKMLAEFEGSAAGAKVCPEYDFHEVCWPTSMGRGSVPRGVSPPRVHVVQVAGGDCHSIALGLDGTVWTWGAYKDKDNKAFYNTGSADTCFGHTQHVPHLVNFSGTGSGDDARRAVEIACGSSFNVARMRDGSVLTWGLGESGQLGRGKPPVLRPDPHSRNYDTRAAHEHHLTPQRVRLPCGDDSEASASVHTIGCGSYRCSPPGITWTFGLNNYGQLGVDPDDASHPFASAAKATENTHEGTVMRVLTAPAPVECVGAGEASAAMLRGRRRASSLVLGMSGAVYSFGRGDAGELG